MNTNEIEFRVRDEKNNIIGYEFFQILFGWHSYLISEKQEDGDYPIHQHTIKDGIDRYFREQFTGITDKNKVKLYDRDIVKTEKGDYFKIEWNKNQSSWWIFQTNAFDIFEYSAYKLGDGYFSRQDLIYVESLPAKQTQYERAED